MSSWHDKTGGMAFPTLDNPGNGLALREAGMTLRDYFAAKAMQGLIISGHSDYNLHTESYRIADDMINESKK